MLTAGDASAEYGYTYDALGRATSIDATITGLTRVVAFAQQFDALGRRTQLAASIGGTADFVTGYAYDDLGRVASITQQGQTGGNAVAEKAIDFLFDTAGQPDTVKRYSDVARAGLVAESNYQFDNAGRLTDLTHRKSGTPDTVFADYDLTWDAARRITAFDFTSLVGDDGDADYAYDDTNQLTGSDYAADWQSDEAYVYDENGNRVNNGYTVGPNNRLTSDGTYTYEYDAEGNRTKRYIPGSPNTDVTEYAWDYRNRLVEVTHYTTEGAAADMVVEYAYDFGNRWVRAVFNPGAADERVTVFVQDNNQIALQFDKTGAGNATATDLTHRYLWGTAVDQILADEQLHYDGGTGNYITDEALFPLTDHLGTVRDVLDANSTVRIHRAYDAFGNVTSEQLRDAANQIVTAGQPGALLELLGFTGKPFDRDTLLNYHLNRWYDLTVGRWASEDPVGFLAGDANLHRYVDNAPTDRSDPSGLWRQRNMAKGQFDPIGPTVFESDRKNDTFLQLPNIVNGIRRKAGKSALKNPANQFFVSPWVPFDKIVSGESDSLLLRMEEAWEEGKPALCGQYDAYNLLSDLPQFAPLGGGGIGASIGTDDNHYIERVGKFYGVPNWTAQQLLQDILGKSGRGQSPISGLLIVGHSGPGSQQIGSRFAAGEKFRIVSLAASKAAAWKKPTFAEARDQQFPAAAWFSPSAVVRFAGCFTNSFAATFADWFLRGDAVAWGTSQGIMPLDDKGRPGWVTFGTFAQFNNPVQIPAAPRSNNPAHFHTAGAAGGYWIGHRGTN